MRGRHGTPCPPAPTPRILSSATPRRPQNRRRLLPGHRPRLRPPPCLPPRPSQSRQRRKPSRSLLCRPPQLQRALRNCRGRRLRLSRWPQPPRRHQHLRVFPPPATACRMASLCRQRRRRRRKYMFTSTGTRAACLFWTSRRSSPSSLPELTRRRFCKPCAPSSGRSRRGPTPPPPPWCLVSPPPSWPRPAQAANATCNATCWTAQAPSATCRTAPATPSQAGLSRPPHPRQQDTQHPRRCRPPACRRSQTVRPRLASRAARLAVSSLPT
mmetsp:Transcript_18826/g.44096  ORF Transcript_18826/g.44096 Transcript_18826/m.44096 type:complete len:270 (+) Transcript_18826:6672-7481(+)